jgi:hypothetical protein
MLEITAPVRPMPATPRPTPLRRPYRPSADSRPRRPQIPGLLAPLALAGTLALLAPMLGGDALSDGIARASRCDAELTGGAARWAACIDRQLAALRDHPVTEAGLRLHAWRFAERAAAQGVRGAADLREAHRRPIADALRGNRISLHRLCAASGLDCTSLAARLDPAV